MAVADYSRTQKIAFTALISALCIAIMSVSRLLPVGIYAIPPICSLFIMVVLIELGVKWSVGCYIITSLMGLLVADPESAMVFIALFGFYPIIKLYIERLRNTFIKWIVKVFIFNSVMIAGYYILCLIVPVLDDLKGQGKIILIALIIVAEVMFVLYDICIARMSVFYLHKYHNTIRRLFKK